MQLMQYQIPCWHEPDQADYQKYDQHTSILSKMETLLYHLMQQCNESRIDCNKVTTFSYKEYLGLICHI